MAEIATAIALLVPWSARVAHAPATLLVPSLAWLPLVGLGIGAAAAALDRLGQGLGPWGGPLLAAMGLALGAGRRAWAEPPWRTLAAALVEVLALCALAPAARTAPLLLAPMLGGWVVTVLAYGGRPRADDGVASLIVGRARFREFGWASVVAMGVTLVLLDAVGLVVLLAVALAALAIRQRAYARGGGLGAAEISLAARGAEVLVLGLLAGLGVLFA